LDDFNRFTLQGSTGAVELRDWFGLQQRQGDGPWQLQGDAAAMRQRGQADQLDQWVALVEGRPHTLPGFAEALAVQETIEALLAGQPATAR
jgi:predicted dehydrogenase